MDVHDSLGPKLFRPRAPLVRYVEFFGYWDRRSGAVHRSRALPRGALTIVIDVSGSDDADFFAADGVTPVAVAPAFAVGAGTQSYITCVAPRRAVLTVHFRPAGAQRFINVSAGELEDRCVSIDQLWGRDGIVLRERLVEESSAARRVALVETFLMSRLPTATERPHPDVATALAAIDANPSMRVSAIREESGLSAKAFTALFRDEVGLAPKAYLRVRRLQAAVRRLDGRGGLGADIAADLGYFDQPHFIREFRGFAQTTPNEYLRSRSPMPGHVDLAC